MFSRAYDSPSAFLLRALTIAAVLSIYPGPTGATPANPFALQNDGRLEEEFVVRPSAEARSLFHGRGTDWGALVDATWGPTTWPVADQLLWFDTVWGTLDSDFPCFEGIPDVWDSLGTAYRAEISAGVSKGRLAAIFNHLALSLRESHTRSYLPEVNSTALAPGIPLMVIGGWGANDHFGAGLTPQPDKSLLVYQAVPAHPLGLVPGDLVLGYEGVPWEQLANELLAAELPIRSTFYWGSAPSSFEHAVLMAAGMNWHLFDTIDIVKHDTGDTLHLSTAPLENAGMSLYCTEQLPVGGVNMPDYPGGTVVTRGRPFGYDVGYIYVIAWTGNAGVRFSNAVNAHYDRSGLIIDFRTNYGGNMFLSNAALEVLFDQIVPTIGWDVRCPGGGHLDFCPEGTSSSFYDIPGDPATFFDKPIAVLVGPGAVSSGDQVALRMKFHPNVRVFGKSTATAFNGPIFGYDTGGGPIVANMALAEAYLLSDPSDHLTHNEFAVDESVWLTPDDVAQGIDTVAAAALAWIQSQVTDAPTVATVADAPRITSFPNPSPGITWIRWSATATATGLVDVAILDVGGRVVRRLPSVPAETGLARWDGTDASGTPVAAGVYFTRVRTPWGDGSRRLAVVR
ncbi:MAG: hypothetical protein KC591_10910 [Gemmatimonadetes bacterium]|nr:hypothetical protein [Gemmatimonadota bacterium]